MANISTYLAAIMAAVRGEEVRGSIHDAIDIINKCQEVAIGAGTAINDGDPKTSQYYEGSLYINVSTDKLLRCGASAWQEISDIRGNGIESITGPVQDGLTDTYTIHYTDGETLTFTVTNGKGIVSVVLYSTVGLIDTYRVTYNDGDTYDFNVTNGNSWHYGTAVSGLDPNPNSFTLPFDVRPGDSYINISDDSIYYCVAGAAAGANSSWCYAFTIASSATGTNNYNMLVNLPKINGVEVKGVQTGHDLHLQDELTEGTGIHINSSTHVISADVDLWLMDNTQTPPVPKKKPMAEGSTSVTFTAAEMADIYTNGWAVKAYFNVADGQPAPTFKKMVKDAVSGDLTITYSKVKAAQAGAGGNECWCQLRIVR